MVPQEDGGQRGQTDQGGLVDLLASQGSVDHEGPWGVVGIQGEQGQLGPRAHQVLQAKMQREGQDAWDDKAHQGSLSLAHAVIVVLVARKGSLVLLGSMAHQAKHPTPVPKGDLAPRVPRGHQG